jgi:hypothetical protein
MEEKTSQVKVPSDIRRMLLTNETVLVSVKQSRWKALFTPDTIAITNQRVIRYSPSGFLGFRKDIEDYRYEDIANLKVNRGLTYATVTLGHRFMSESLVLSYLPKGRVAEISRAVEENISRTRGTMTSIQVPSAPPLRNALEVLRLRFANGEITREQFEEMKSTLE